MTDENRSAEAILGALKAPLNGLAGILHLLNASSLSTSQQAYVSVLRATTAQLATLVDDGIFLSMDSVDLRQPASNYRPRAVFEATVDAFRSLVQLRGGTLHLEVAEDLPEIVLGDELALRQLSFAAFEQIIADGSAPLQCTVVWNAGEIVARVTTPAQRLTMVNTVVKNAKAYADHVGGSWAIAANTKGAACTFSVPARVSDDGIESSRATNIVPLRDVFVKHRAATRSAQIVLIEDQEIARTILTTVLTRAGHKVTVFDRAKSALMALQNGLPANLILVDLHLPDLHGAAMIKEFRMMDCGRTTPVLGISGDDSPAAVKLCQSAGMIGLLAKPSRPDAILASISFALSPAPAPLTLVNHQQMQVIDKSALSDIEALGGRDLVCRLVQQTLIDARTCVVGIERASTLLNASEWRNNIHALRGVALTLGATQLIQSTQSALDNPGSWSSPTDIALLSKHLKEAATALSEFSEPPSVS